jgi:monofunctional biosynthetic peptidoglycan transglycosylase
MASDKVEGPRPRLPSRVRRILVRALQVLAGLLAASILATLLLRWIPPLTTAVMMERRIGSWLDGRAYHVDYRWVTWKRISLQAPLAVIAAEDQNFATHHGFDFKSIQNDISGHSAVSRLTL